MVLSVDEVRIAWRALTDEAMPDDGLIDQMRALPSLNVMRRMVMETHAFQLSMPRGIAKVALTAPCLAIETQVDADTAARLLMLVRRKWHQMGVERPHWSVTAKDEFPPDRAAGNRAAFDATGEADLAMILATLARAGLALEQFPHVLDFGCGVGRISFPLAERCAVVTGCDVSEAHLQVARDEAARRGFSDMRFTLLDAPDFGMTAPFDFWFSHLVLQHNPPPIMAMMLRRMFAMLSPGGVSLFQIPTYVRGYGFDAAAYLAAPPRDLMEVHLPAQYDVLALAREAGCDVLEIREESSVWPPSEAISNMMLFQKRNIVKAG